MNKNNSIAVIDYVGTKSGMNYYDSHLLFALDKLGMKGYLFSNFQIDRSEIISQKCFEVQTPQNAFRKLIDFYGGILQAFKACKKQKVKTVILHLFSADLKDLLAISLAYLLRLRVILIIHDADSLGKKEVVNLRSKIYRLAKALVAHNHFSGKEIKRLIDASPNMDSKLKVIPHGHYISLADPSVNKQKAKFLLGMTEPGVHYLLFFGQIKKSKGLDLLLKALALSDENVKLVIAGRPWKENFDGYDKLIKDLSIEHKVIKRIYYISDDERELLFKACDTLIIPYLKIYQSGVLLMGMSYDIPVIASDLEANKEIIKHGYNGLLFENDNHNSLAMQIRQLSENENLSEQLKTNANKNVLENHSWKKIAEQYKELIVNN